MPTPVTSRRRLYAVVCWFGCLLGFGVAFNSAVLAIDIGPFSVAVAAVIAVMVAIGVANAVGFWRYSNALGGRPVAASIVLLIAVGWAALGAALVHAVFQAFNPIR
jgi:hypothetical protein